MFRRKLGLLVNLGVSLILLLPTPTLANKNNLLGGYTASPKAKKVSQRRSVGGGTRSNCQNLFVKDDLTLLVPQEKVVHLTATNKPSFFFYTQVASTTPLAFTLVDPDQAEPLVEETLLVERTGSHQLTLPESVTLEPNKIYLWHIGIPCDNDPDTFQEVLGAAVEYSPISPEISAQLQLTTSPLEKAQIFASQGFWYDALYFAFRASSELRSSAYWQQLLSDIDIPTTNGQNAYEVGESSRIDN